MKIALTASVAAALLLAGPGAMAHASATAHIGDVSVTQDGSGANFGITFWQVSLGSFESASRVFDYSVTLHTDGLPATRTWDDSTPFACLPLHEMKCGPEATGMELVEAYLETYRDGREANPFIDYSGIFATDLFYSDAGSETVSGSFTLTATNTGLGPQSDSISLFASLWVDASEATPAVPEPGGLALGLTGLSAVLAGLRRGRRGR